MFNHELGTRGLAVRIGTALCDGGVANMSCSGSSRQGRLCVRRGVDRLGMHKQGEGVHVVAFPKVSELSIVAALRDRGVRSSTRSRKSSNGGRPRVEVGFKARHLLKKQRENTLGGIEIALLRAWVRGIRR